jgi:peptide-methionine (S)-S-oxide reductase
MRSILQEAVERASQSTSRFRDTSLVGVYTVRLATFGAGCFWGVEAEFRRVPGVIDTAVGYSGGQVANPTYDDVCTDTTGHAEVVQVTYDPARVAYDQLLEVFWTCHDPTQVDRQGPDLGSQYRSAIFYHDEEQKSEAQESKARFESMDVFRRPIATQIVPAMPFYCAEEYHQRYLEKRGIESCSSDF